MAEETKEPKKDRRKTAGGLLVAAGLFIGMGVGWTLGYLVPGLFIGLGAGLLAYGIVVFAVRD